MAKGCRYVDEQDFRDFKDNFHLMIETFNHNVTDIKTDVGKIKTEVMNNTLELVKTTNETKSVKSLVWWLMGIVSAIVIAAIVGSIKG